QTPNAGEHHIFKQPSGFKIGNRTVMRGIDTRGYRLENAGGYVIGPGSILPDGGSWKPAKGSPPFLATLTKGLVEIPAGLADRLREKEVPQTPPVQRSAGKNEEAWSLAALNRIASDVAGMQADTGRDNALVSAAGTMGRMVKAGW